MLKKKKGKNDDEIIGKRVRVKKCEARKHGDNEGCVCHLISQVVEIEKRYETPFAGTPSYHIKGMKYRVRRREVTLIKNQQAVVLAGQRRKCRKTLEMNVDHIEHLKHRMRREGRTPYQAVIAILNVDDVHGGPIVDDLAPGYDWQEIRDKGEIPFWRGLLWRYGIHEALKDFDTDAATRLQETTYDLVALIIDHGVAEVFKV